MSKKNPHSFRQLPPPQFAKIFSITQPETQLILQHWKNLFACIQLQILPNVKHMCLLYKANACISLVCFQDACLIYQRKFKVNYAQVYEITCIKMHPIIIKYKQTKKRQTIVALGFFNGAIELYHLNMTDKTVVLKKQLTFQSDLKQPVTNIVVSKGNMFVSRLHSVQVYRQCFGMLADVIIKEQYNKQTKVSQTQLKCTVKNLPIGNLAQGMTVSISCGKNSLHVFNESEGAKTYLLQSLEQYGIITDSITFLHQILDQNMVIGDTYDKLKIIYKNRNLVQKYVGFKNYCSDVCHLVFQKHQELWISDYHGCITYMQRNLQTDKDPEKYSSIKMSEIQTHFSVKVIDSGIKKLIVISKMLIILDTQSNIHLFDIVRKETGGVQQQIQLQSINQYSSDN